MRVIALVNGRVGAEVTTILARSPACELTGIVVHPRERARCRTEIVAASGLEPDRVLEGTRLETDEGRDWLTAVRPDLGVSAYFGFILSVATLDRFPQGVLNLHPALLPYNRGSFTNVWSIVEGTPAGVTLHRMDPGVDTGPILAQREVRQRLTDTGESLYQRLEAEAVELFHEQWPRIAAGGFELRPQDESKATCHRVADVEAIDRIDLDGEYRARDLLNRLRARTFAGQNGCYVVHEGRKVFLELALRPESPSLEKDDRDAD